MRNPGRRQPLPIGLTQPERDFFNELRRLTGIAGYSYRTLEELTSSFKSATDDPSFYSKSQWSRWLNGQAVPPRNAVRKLAEVLAAEDVTADHLLDLWSRVIELATLAEASPAGHGPAPSPQSATASFPVPSAEVLVGRESELRLLTGWVEQAVRGRGGAVLIEGEAGIGKSALARAAVAQAARAGCQTFWGAGDELGQALPLLPFLDGLRVREPSANPRRNMIVGLLRGEVAAGRGADVPATLAEQLLALVAEQCAARPVVLVIDDLQWVDPASGALWGRLARSAWQLPLLLIGLTRPAPRRKELLALRRALDEESRVQLAGLDEAAVADLVAALAGGWPDEGLRRLAEGAAGNPLYVTELVAALIRSSGVAVTNAGIVRLTTGSAPGSLSAAIADRLGLVTGPVREMLQAAALLGTDFAVPDLAVVAGRGVTDLVPLVDEACAMGVLSESGQGLGFRHTLIRATLYDDMPAPLRVAWHRDAARALAEAGAPPDRVARQLLRAVGEPGGPPTPADTAPVDDWVLGWLARTADSLVGQAPGVAAELLARAVASSPPGFQRDRLAARLSDALYRIGDVMQAERVASQTLAHATSPDIVVDLHWTLAQCRIVVGASTESLATLDEALGSPGISSRHRARLLVLAARTHLHLGEAARAGQVAAMALEAAPEAEGGWATAWALHVLTLVTAEGGDVQGALLLFDRALAATESDPGLTDLRLLLQINQAIALGVLDRYEAALTVAGQARDLAREVGTTVRLGQAHSALSQLLFETGRWDDALAEIEALPEYLREPSAACCDHGIVAVICFHRGETGPARRHLAAANSEAKRLGRRLVGPLMLARSLDREQDGALPEALAALTGALDGRTDELLEIEELLADAVRLADENGDRDTARTLTEQAAVLASASETPHRQATAIYCRALLDHDARRLLVAADRYAQATRPLPRAKALEAAAAEFARAGDRAQARAACAGAMAVYTALGAAADVGRLRAGL
jgi:tetratricopeptide (TPR) repeat protein